ncbi:MAG: MaoC family dehydratase N-terminal domain-containing protein [Candidatus Bathyarchaeota archaeon]
MSEQKVKTIQDFIDDSRKLLGWPTSHPGVEWINEYQIYKAKAGVSDIQDFSLAMGDDNPLYIDPKYGRKTRYGTMIAHPTYTSVLRYNMWRGANGYGRYAAVSLVAGFAWEWNDVLRVGDEFKTSCVCQDVVPKKGATGTLCFTYSHAGFWNQYNELVATGRAGNCMIGREQAATNEGFRGEMVYERGVYRYSDEEIKKIVKDILAEERRGATPRYWEDVKEGDKLVPVVKGPMQTNDFMAWDQAMAALALNYYSPLHRRGAFELAIRRAVEDAEEREGQVNTMTNWPYGGGNRHYDWDACKSSGMPAPFDVGCFRACATSHLLSNWMGDDGFLRRVELQLRKPSFYGDTTWFYAEVVKKYKDKVGNEEYGAVDIKITGTNELGEVCAPGIATVYLPLQTNPVKLPVPHDDKYEEYREYLRKCDELQSRRRTDLYWPIT